VHQFAGRLFVVALSLFGGIHFVKGDEPSSAAVDLILYVAMGSSAVVYLWTADVVRRHRPTFHGRRESGRWIVEAVPPERRRVKKRALRKRALQASEQIYAFLAESRQTDPTSEPWFWTPGWETFSEEEKNQAFHEHSAKLIRHARETMDRYNASFAAEALVLHAEFERRGVTDGSARFHFEHPTDPLGVEEVARELGVWGRQL
jgi:hypothetical protein